jgi:Ca-activated chloride channel homolog
MNHTVPMLTDEEIRRTVSPDNDAGLGALSTEKGLLPLRAVDVRARIDGLAARTTLTESFVNALDEPLEATYIFPLPDRAAVTQFRMEVAGRIIEGELKERAAARQEYDQAQREGRRAAIAEEERSGVFSLRVGNLMPGEEARIRLTLVGRLAYDDGEATFRFPLVVAPRYIPGTPLPGASVGDGVAPDTDAVPDASRITPPVLLPGFPNPVRLSLHVELHPQGLKVGEVRSSLHTIVEEEAGTRRFSVEPGERLDRDFILRFQVGDKAIQSALTLCPDTEGKEGTFLLTLVPPGAGAARQKPRDVAFVLDRSGSMRGWKMVAARRALARMVDTLGSQDRLAVLAFDDEIDTPPAFAGRNFVPGNDRNRFRAVEFLAAIDARGGTELARPLNEAVDLLTGEDAGRDRILVLVTDGQVGNEDQILSSLAAKVKNLRIFTLGIDMAVNEGFLKRLASLGGGFCELVESEDRLDAVMDKLHRRIGTPLLTGLHLESNGLQLDAESLVPRRLPDLFAGAPLLLMGRYRDGARGGLVIQSRDALGQHRIDKIEPHVGDGEANRFLWARGHLRELEDRFITGNEDLKKLEKRIVETSLKFGVLCRFTAFVAVDVKEIVNPDGKVHRITQPVEPAAGWAMLGTDTNDLERAVCCSAPAMACESFLMEFADAEEAAIRAPLASRNSPVRGRGLSLGSLFRRLKKAKGPLPPPQSIDLTAYRRRAAELLERMKAAAETDRINELRLLAEGLSALVEDLQSIGAAESDVQPLAVLLKDLEKFVATINPTHAEVDSVWTRAATVLRAFTGRRERFWA